MRGVDCGVCVRVSGLLFSLCVRGLGVGVCGLWLGVWGLGFGGQGLGAGGRGLGVTLPGVDSGVVRPALEAREESKLMCCVNLFGAERVGVSGIGVPVRIPGRMPGAFVLHDSVPVFPSHVQTL